MKNIKITRTLMNQLIIGETTETSHLVKIHKPYNVALTVDSIELYPFDKEIIQTDIEDITLSKENLMYWTQPGESLINAYIQARTGLQTEAPQIIT